MVMNIREEEKGQNVKNSEEIHKVKYLSTPIEWNMSKLKKK